MVEFVLVLGLLLLLVFGVVQVALVLHLRAVVTADAAEGARHEAAAGAARGAGADRAETLLDGSVGAATRARLACTSTRARPADVPDSLPPVVTVRCAGDVPLSLLRVRVRLEGVGHALLEAP